MAASDDVDLTPEAKLAVQRYVWKIAVPSAAVLSLISALVGFVIDRVARIEASEASMARINEAETKAEVARQKAEFVVEELTTDVNNNNTQIQKQQDQIRSMISNMSVKSENLQKTLEGKLEDIVKEITKSDEFRKLMAEIPSEEVSRINGRMDKIENRQIVTGMASVASFDFVGTGPVLVSSKIGFEPDYCAITKVEIGNIDSMCRVYVENQWKASSGRQANQLACSVTCFKLREASIK